MADKKPTTKAHRGFIHIPKRRRQIRRRLPIQIGPDGRPIRFPGDFFGPRRPPRFPGFPGFPRFPGIGGPRRPIRQPVRPPRGPFRPRGPRVDPSPDIRRDPKKLRDFIRRQRERDRLRRIGAITPRPTVPDRMPTRRPFTRGGRRISQFTQGLGRLGSSIFNRATRAQKRAKGGMAFKSKDYVNPSNTVDNKKK
jgi:hypothetical protein